MVHTMQPERIDDTLIHHDPQEQGVQEGSSDFARTLGGLQWGLLLISVLALGSGLMSSVWQLSAVAGLIAMIWLAALVSRNLARRQQLGRAVSLLSGAMLLLLSAIPVFLSGLVPAILMIDLIAIMLIGRFHSPRMVPRAVVGAALCALAALLLDFWSPYQSSTPAALSTALSVIGLISSGIHIYQYASSLDSKRGAMEQQLADTRHSQATLSQREQALAQTVAAYEARQHNLEAATRKSEHQASLLQATIDISRTLTQIRDQRELLSKVTQLISDRLGYYHVGLFLIDQDGLSAVLQASNSQAGRRMLARGHQLRVGATGIVGFATGTGHPRIALDVGADLTYFDNPDLPETRSEVALPLRIGTRTIGALDIQSKTQNAFDEDDVVVLGALADQIAVAIENAELLQQTQTALEQAEAVQRRYVREAWDGLMGSNKRRVSTN